MYIYIRENIYHPFYCLVPCIYIFSLYIAFLGITVLQYYMACLCGFLGITPYYKVLHFALIVRYQVYFLVI